MIFYRCSRIILAVLLIGGGVIACSGKTTPKSDLIPITVQLLWTHNATFSGFYAADQQGYYSEEDLSVQFLEGGPTTDLLAAVLDGKVQFGIARPDNLLLARSEGKPLVAIAALNQHSPIVFAALAGSGITRPEDFVGKTIRSTPQLAITLRAITAKVGMQPDQYQEVNLPSDLETFEKGQAQVWGIYFNNFRVTLQQAGYDLNYIYPDDYGVHFYGDVLFTTDDLIKEKPDLVLRFLRATIRGHTFAVENPEKAAGMVLKYAAKANPQAEAAKWNLTIPLVNSGKEPIGWMKPEIWERMAEILVDQGLTKEPLDAGKVYSMMFLEEVYSN